MDYNEFLRSKQDYGADSGFDPLWMPDFLFDFQVSLVDWAIRKGRAAIFADCGLGKTPMQLVWAQNVIQKTNKPVMVLTPLAVSFQTLREAEKFDIEAHLAMKVWGNNPPASVHVTNYEKLHYFDAAEYGGVVCDESSILKNYDGKIKGEVTEFMRQVPYRLLCTATAAPNDWEELGTSSEALGYLGYTDMLTKFFTNKQRSIKTGRGRFRQDKWRLKGWAEKGPFWQWVVSWARAARKPSDLGFDDRDFILPELTRRHTMVEANRPADGMLFDVPATNWREEREAIRRTINERCEMAAEKISQNGGVSIAWCHLNDEGDLLERLIPNAVQVSGRDSDEKKEEAVKWFVHGKDDQRRLVSKPKILGFGLNLQHCAHMTYFPTHSYEMLYQSERRVWRFGQLRDVLNDLIYTNGGKRIMQNLDRKAHNADQMFNDLVRYMGNELHIEENYTRKEIEVPQWITK